MAMNDDQWLIELGMRYLESIEQGEETDTATWLEGVEPHLWAEVQTYLEALYQAGDPFEPIELTEDERAFAQSMAGYEQRRLRELLYGEAPRTLTDVRKAANLSVGKLARRLNLPIGLLDRLERGGILLSTLPARLTRQLAEALSQTEDQIQALLHASQRNGQTRQASYLSARDGTTLEAEAPLAFADALERCLPTAEQRHEWGT